VVGAASKKAAREKLPSLQADAGQQRLAGNRHCGGRAGPCGRRGTSAAGARPGCGRTGTCTRDLPYEQANGAGTGMVLTASGQVLTNYHVVEGAGTIASPVA
jgi:S1-C subfamily serine protease